jgi:molybdenum cofactor cytidylyltransferase
MQLGLEAAGDADAYMFCVCDQPYLTAATVERLIDTYKKGTAGIVSLAWQGKMYNPKIFSSRYKNELMELSGDTGGRQIIASQMSDLLLVEAASEDEVLDIDSL